MFGYSGDTEGDIRVKGGVAYFLGIVATWIGIINPIWSAINNAPSISYSKMLAALGCIGPIMGLIMMIFGARANTIFSGNKGLIFVIAVTLIGILFMFLPEIIISKLGYY